MKRGYWIALGAALAALALVLMLTRPNEESKRRSAAVVEMAEAWSGEIQFASAYAALDPATVSSEEAPAAAAAGAFNPDDDYWGLPRNPGFEDVAAYCAACHSLQLVMQQNKSARGWGATIQTMIDKQGMPAPQAADRRRIVDYLARNYGEPTQAQP